MERYADWPERLIAYIEDVQRAGFRPGRHDCALFAAGAVKAMTGTDLAAQFVGNYRTLAEGVTMLNSLGFDDHVALAAEALEEIPPLMARAGDVAVVEGKLDLSLGIVQGPYIYVLTENGIGPVPLTDAKRAFRV